MTIARELSSHFGNSHVARGRAGWWTALAVVSVTTVGMAQRAHHSSNDSLAPAGGPAAVSTHASASPRNHEFGALPAAAQASISASIGEDERAYHALEAPRGFRTDNANHGVSAEFTAAGVEFHRGTNRWGIALRGYGYGDTARATSAVAPHASANRVEYRRGAVTEWYVNGPLGLEQGLTLDSAPDAPKGDALTVAFALSGNLTPSVASGGRALVLSRNGSAALRYSGLTAWDADRRELRTWLEVAGDELRVRVDDAGARYPITVDPYVQAPRLTAAKPCDPDGTCDDGAWGDELGMSVSISADAGTVVVGAPYKYTNSVLTGAAYVFVKPNDYEGGWNSFYPIRYKTKLLPSDPITTGRELGWSVDISRDGGTIVAGALGAQATGAAYVFIRPAAGWGSVRVQTQTAKLMARPSSNGVDYGSFGRSIAISGDGSTIAVGSPDYEIDGVWHGVAYVFLRPPTGWVNALESQKLTGTPYSIYGHAVTLSDDASILAVGAPWENPLGGAANFIGTTHVLARRTNPGSPDSYAPVAKLVSSDGVPTDFFGASISASGDGSTIVVGAPVNVYEEPPHAGAAYVFVRPKRGWGVPTFSVAEAAKLTTTDSWENDRFGQAVDISVDGRTIVVTGRDRPLLPGTIPGPGAGYFFAKRATGWAASTENTKVPTPEGLTAEGFGMSTALSGDGRVSIFGAPFETIDANVAQGAAYVFTGSANDPIASVSPGNLTFASQPVGSTSSPRTVTMTNTGAGPLHIASVGVIGPFVTTQNCVSASPLAPGASCSEAVAFAPASMDQATIGRLTFTDDSRGTPETTQYVQLQGTARKANTTTTISLSASRVRVGQPVIVSFSVAAEPGSTLQPFGTVTVLATTGESCTSGVVSGSCTVAFSTVGNRTVTATYNGNVNFNPSTSSGTTVRVVN